MVLAVHPAALEHLDALVRDHQAAEERWLAEETKREQLALLRGAERRAGAALSRTRDRCVFQSASGPVRSTSAS
ncbi:hypothetical protein [Streptomyces sp. NPDC059918]|uniref:hypothetical protein n=1 Tax=unclassified Streptomyces TaxID=2593676 RepID=UPI0036656770